MVVNATFNNISVISWRSVLLVVETGVPGEKHPPDVLITPRMSRFELTTLVVIGTDSIGSNKSNSPYDHHNIPRVLNRFIAK